jgi:hypothetical protein
MFKYLVMALLLSPSMAVAGQATGKLSVGMRIIADSADTQNVKSTRASVRGVFIGSGGTPFRRYVVQGGNGLRIQITEF